ncbi:hypothetical protein KTT_13290 [Tengunoibacter tsumagoiensis]|uniref:Uncharacterized protein n=1 Tax=Tengunoibacter tsumagoiensis TaxID=2014871 RepID=A0A401ZX95_9CHLR|nr:hypothetical protein KTT_13290 [Tengunoibacter tsumagoiensis]
MADLNAGGKIKTADNGGNFGQLNLLHLTAPLLPDYFCSLSLSLSQLERVRQYEKEQTKDWEFWKARGIKKSRPLQSMLKGRE